MPSTRVKEKLAGEISGWQLDGIIDDDKRSLLATRYEAAGWNLGVALKYVGMAGAILSGLGLLGAAGAASQSAAFAALLLVSVGAGLLFAGFALAKDARARYGGSSKVIIAVGLSALASAIVLCAKSAAANESTTLAWLAVLLPLTLVLAYSQRSVFLLLLFVISLFHWLAAWGLVVGHSSGDALDLRVLVAAAIAVFAFGLWHERLSAKGWPRFDLVYEAAALTYLNLALLGLCIERDQDLFLVAAFAVGAIGQIVLGAKLKNSLSVGFGVAAAVVVLVDVYFDHFWRADNDQGLFLLGGGVLLIATGWVAESGLRLLQRRAMHG